MTRIQLRRPQIGKFAIARPEPRVNIETGRQLEQGSDELGFVGEHLHDVEDAESCGLVFFVYRAHLRRGFVRFDSWNPRLGYALLGFVRAKGEKAIPIRSA